MVCRNLIGQKYLTSPFLDDIVSPLYELYPVEFIRNSSFFEFIHEDSYIIRFNRWVPVLCDKENTREIIQDEPRILSLDPRDEGRCKFQSF